MLLPGFKHFQDNTTATAYSPDPTGSYYLIPQLTRMTTKLTMICTSLQICALMICWRIYNTQQHTKDRLPSLWARSACCMRCFLL